MSTETQLISETEKWLIKAEKEFEKIKHKGKRGEEFAKNISAYLSDTKYFSKNKDYVRAFETVIWAWAWIEIGKDVGVLQSQ